MEPEPPVRRGGTVAGETAENGAENGAEKELARLLALGADRAKALTTAMFFHDPRVLDAFGHKNYGFKSKGPRQNNLFVNRKNGNPTRWFRGSTPQTAKPLKRAQERLEALRDRPAPGDPLFLFAHDYPVQFQNNPVRQIVKIYGLLSPWDFLWSLSRTEDVKQKATEKVFLAGAPRAAAHLSPEELECGERLDAWPCSSLYTFRPFDDARGDYAFTVDVDGKYCMSEEDRAAKNETVAKRVIAEFEGTGEREPRLRVIGETLKRLVRAAFGYEGPAYVSWHRSTGWKPSWRGYLVGPTFLSLRVAKAFVLGRLLPALAEEHPSWFAEGVVDEAAYGRGQDRCLGSAKLELGRGVDMRFLQISPLEGSSDPHLVNLFYAHPNEYILTVTGLMYRPDFSGNFLGEHGGAVEACPRKRVAGERKRRDVTRDVAPGSAAALVGEILHEEGLLARPAWGGHLEQAVELAPGKVALHLRAGEADTACVFKKAAGGAHASGGKMVFRLVLDTRVSEATLSQKCYSCNPKSFERVATRCKPLGDVLARTLQTPDRARKAPRSGGARSGAPGDEGSRVALEAYALKLIFV